LTTADQSKILLINYDTSLHEFLDEELTHLGHTIESAFNGEAGLPPHTLDVIILDLTMTGMSGFEFATGSRSIRPRRASRSWFSPHSKVFLCFWVYHEWILFPPLLKSWTRAVFSLKGLLRRSWGFYPTEPPLIHDGWTASVFRHDRGSLGAGAAVHRNDSCAR